MSARKRPLVGILGLMIELYDGTNPELRPNREEFGRKVAEELSAEVDVVFPGIVNTREGVRKVVSDFEAGNCDAVLVIPFSYAPSLISLDTLSETPLPIMLWTCQECRRVGRDFTRAEYIENHGLQGVQDLANVLTRSGRDFSTVAGHWRDERAKSEIFRWARAADALSRMRSLKVGRLGGSFEDMGDFDVPEETIRQTLGVEVVDIDEERIARILEAVQESEVRKAYESDVADYPPGETITFADYAPSGRLEKALRIVVAEDGLGALAPNFMGISQRPELGTIPFLAACKMMPEGFGYGGEGDPVAATGVVLARALFGQATFAEMFVADFEASEVLMSHMGEANLAMARTDARPQLVLGKFPFGELAPPVSLRFGLRPGPVVLFCLTFGAGDLPKIITADCEVSDWPLIDCLETPHYKIRPAMPVEDFLRAYAANGGSHHLALADGTDRSVVDTFCRVAGIEHVRL